MIQIDDTEPIDDTESIDDPLSIDDRFEMAMEIISEDTKYL
jgi:hypothetical protein